MVILIDDDIAIAVDVALWFQNTLTKILSNTIKIEHDEGLHVH